MEYLSKSEIISEFRNNKLRVFYKNKKDPIDYSNYKHVNWKNVVKFTVLFDKIKVHTCNGEKVARDGASFLFKEE